MTTVHSSDQSTPRVIVLALSMPGLEDREALIRNTWANAEWQQVLEAFYFYHGNGTEAGVQLHGDTLVSSRPETLHNIGYKTLEVFEWLLEHHDFDFLFRTNTSSYVHIPKLLEHLQLKPRSNYYSGTLLNHRHERRYYGFYWVRHSIDFASGAGYIVTPDLMRFALKQAKRNKWPHRWIDDVALGFILQQAGISLRHEEYHRVDVVHEDLHYRMHESAFHYRCKHEHNRKADLEVMKKLHTIWNEPGVNSNNKNEVI